MVTRLLTLATGFAAFFIACMAGGELRRRGEKRQLKQEVQRWEDEGGNVPEVETVSPRVRPPSSVP